jgi:hypothetical protein
MGPQICQLITSHCPTISPERKQVMNQQKWLAALLGAWAAVVQASTPNPNPSPSQAQAQPANAKTMNSNFGGRSQIVLFVQDLYACIQPKI